MAGVIKITLQRASFLRVPKTSRWDLKESHKTIVEYMFLGSELGKTNPLLQLAPCLELIGVEEGWFLMYHLLKLGVDRRVLDLVVPSHPLGFLAFSFLWCFVVGFRFHSAKS